MDLNEAQIQAVRSWVAEGASLAEVQDRLQAEFQVSMTYMDVRFLVDDIGAELFSEPEPEPEPDPAPTGAPEADDAEAVDLEPVDEPMDAGLAEEPEPAFGEPEASPSPGGDGQVSVEVDKLMRPGAVISGTVTFSDGVTANWQIDQLGRLGIIPPQEGYQPPEADIPQFQAELQQLIQRQGF